MSRSGVRLSAAVAVIVGLFVAGSDAIFAVQAPETSRRFDDLVIADPGASIDVVATPVGTLPANDHARAGWESFRAAHGQAWQIHLDRRSGAPLLVEGKGIPWPGTEGATVSSLASSLRSFIAARRSLLLADDAELVFDNAASGPLSDDVWQIVFRREVAGIPVAGERYVFTIGHGNLIAFGTPRWSRIDASPIPDLTAGQAQERLSTYMKLTAADVVSVVSGPSLELIPLSAAGAQSGASRGRYVGPLGSGYASALVWRLAFRVEGEEGTWLGRVKGGVYPISNDQFCPSGCEQPNYPMPFADIFHQQRASAAGERYGGFQLHLPEYRKDDAHRSVRQGPR